MSEDRQAFSAKSRSDVEWLSQRVGNSAEVDAPFVAANIMARGLMRMNWWMHLVVRFSAWRQGADRGLVWASTFRRAPMVAAELINTTADWIVNGKDADGEGIGGFNQREVDQMVAILNRAGVA